VGEEVSTHFRKLFPEWSAAANDGNKRMLDLIEANRRILIAAGVPDGHIYDSGLCTFCCASEFYSFRREPNDPGRMASYIGRKH
jgi:copper oxidase (laccase) domain-containing protein